MSPIRNSGFRSERAHRYPEDGRHPSPAHTSADSSENRSGQGLHVLQNGDPGPAAANGHDHFKIPLEVFTPGRGPGERPAQLAHLASGLELGADLVHQRARIPIPAAHLPSPVPARSWWGR